jgi:Ca-activated chloride channel family protein
MHFGPHWGTCSPAGIPFWLIMKQRTTNGVFWMFVVGFTAISLFGQTSRPGTSRKICVVAVHDSSLLTMCLTSSHPAFPDKIPPALTEFYPLAVVYSPGLDLSNGKLDMARPDWTKLALSWPGISPSGWIDLDLQQRTRREFDKHKEYRLVDSPDQADIVFVIEARYRTVQTKAAGAATVNSLGNRDTFITGDTGIGSRFLGCVMAVAIPAEAYRAGPEDVENWIRAKSWGDFTWEHLSGGRVIAAPVEKLVQQFINNRNSLAPTVDICAAFAGGKPADVGEELHPSSPAPKSAESGLILARPESAQTAAGAFKVNVTLVTIPVIASDADGKSVPGLGPGDFHLFENGVEQQIDRVIPESEPFNVALMLDSSRSTTASHTEIQSAALAFLDAMRPDDRVMLVSFGNYIQVESELTSDRNQLRRAILQTKTSGMTRLHDALELVLSQRLSRIQGRKAIVLLSDGVDNGSRLSNLAMSLARIQESDVLVYVAQFRFRPDMGSEIWQLRPRPIAVQTGEVPELSQYRSRASEFLRDLSASSGGRRLDADSALNLKDAFLQIADELRHQYALCYYPVMQMTEPTFSRIQVTLDRPGVKIRTRLGYRTKPKR